MSRRVIFRARTLADIDDAYRWYEEQRHGLGVEFMAELGKVDVLIGESPELFQRVRGPVRRAMLHKFPYGAFYIVKPEFVSVIAVMHHARDPKQWQRRAGAHR